ncbi:ribonuclease T2 [Heteronotia binoei]|uniref:ribonuclease T2 n=1 Tax=Heteronotia binoei TaxID=13085 RepID=UPI0029309898|nr:ribonuclease T2 [Heteronotia binoei]
MSENDCNNPPMYWTIHGLWTDKAEDCDKTWHFNITEIKNILVDMRQYWPDVLHENRTKFWVKYKQLAKSNSVSRRIFS